MSNRNWKVLLGFLIVGLVLGHGSVPAEASTCTTARTLEPQGRSVGEVVDGTAAFRVPIPSAGVLLIRGGTPANETAQPHLLWLTEACGTGEVATVIRRTPTEVVLRFPAAGTAFFALTPEDPASPLSTYKVQTAFAAEPTLSKVIPLSGEVPGSCNADGLPTFTPEPLTGSHGVELQRQGAFFKDVDPIDCEVVAGSLTTGGVVVVEGADALRATVYAGTACAPEDRRAESVLGAGGFAAATVHAGEVRLDLQAARLSHYTLGVKFFALCDAETGDDHADLPLCATPLRIGGHADGRIGDGHSLDDDFFTFQVESQQTIRIIARSEKEANLILYDEAGQPLVRRQICARGCAGRIIRTLGKGRYYLRLGGQEMPGGSYTVTVR